MRGQELRNAELQQCPQGWLDMVQQSQQTNPISPACHLLLDSQASSQTPVSVKIWYTWFHKQLGKPTPQSGLEPG
jgi:hypothetical protein